MNPSSDGSCKGDTPSSLESPSDAESATLQLLKPSDQRLTLANLIRMYEKKWFGRGPNEVSVEIVGQTIVFCCKAVLAKHELSLVHGRPDRESSRVLLDFRMACFERSKESLVRSLSDVLGQRSLEIGYCLFARANESVYVVRMSRPIHGPRPDLADGTKSLAALDQSCSENCG
ncbi:DUF2294 domain-containing protein [bacterium]|nr:DUF2294 domain-containing protein [bacterium]